MDNVKIKICILTKRITASIILTGMPALDCQAQPVGIAFIERSPTEHLSYFTLSSPQRLNRSSTIDIEYLTDFGQEICCHQLSGDLFKEVQSTGRVSADDQEAPIYTYQTPSRNLKHSADVTGTVILNADSVKKLDSGPISATSDGKTFQIERCYGIDGINLFLKRKGATVEHLYLYLNIDIESTCK